MTQQPARPLTAPFPPPRPLSTEPLPEQEKPRAQLHPAQGLTQPVAKPPCSEPRLPSRDLITAHLRTLFTHFASFGDRLNAEKLASSKFYRLLSEAGVVDDRLDRRQIDILFRKINGQKSHMDFQTFVKGIPEIALAKFLKPAQQAISSAKRRGSLGPRKPPVAPRSALTVLMQQYLIPLSQSIQTTATQDGPSPLSLEGEDVQLSKVLLQAVYAGLFEVYQAYFPWEVKGAKSHLARLRAQSQKQVFLFCHDFDICPLLITKPTVFQLWQKVIAAESVLEVGPQVEGRMKSLMGVAFTFNRFLDFLVRASHSAFNEKDVSLPQCLYSLLGRMELSKGFMTLESKTDRPHTAKITLLPSRSLFQDVLTELMLSQGQDPHPLSNPSASLSFDARSPPLKTRSGTRADRGLSPAKQRSLQQEAINQEIEQEVATTQIYETHRQMLSALFQSYCAYGQPLNTNHLGSSKFIKLLRDSKIIRAIKPRHAEMRHPDTTTFEPSALKKASPGGGSRFGSASRRGSYNESVLLDLAGPYIMKPTEADLLFSSITGRGDPASRGKMDFQIFLKAIESIAKAQARKVQTSFKEALKEVVEQYLEPVYRELCAPVPANAEQGKRHFGQEQVVQLMKLLQEDGMVEMLGLVHRTLYPFFIKYTIHGSPLMNFEGFVRFCKDFGIFPDVLPKSRILQFFHTLSQIFSASDNPVPANRSISQIPPVQKQALIDEHLFTESIGLCAMDAPYLPPNEQEITDFTHVNKFKVIYLLERMSQSEGPEKVLRTYGHTRITGSSPGAVKPSPQPHDLLFLIRQEMPQFFEGQALSERHWMDDVCSDPVGE